MAFHDIRLPEDIERGAQGGPGFKTTIMTLSSGHEKRNIDWQRTRGKWDIGYGIQEKADLKAVIDFFYARQARAHSFRFKDWSDYHVGDPYTDTPQIFAEGNGVLLQFQIEKHYTSGGYTFVRPITRIVAGSARVFVNSVELLSGWTINTSTGILTFSSAPANLSQIAIFCEFDVPVRFDMDNLEINMETFESGTFPQLPVVEVKDE